MRLPWLFSILIGGVRRLKVKVMDHKAVTEYDLENKYKAN